MVVAVIAVRVMQMALDEVVHVVAVWNGLMPAVLAVNMAGFVPFAPMLRRAAVRVVGIDRERVLIDMITVGMVQVAAVYVVDMTLVLDRRVAAARLVPVRMILVYEMLVHGRSVRHEGGEDKPMRTRSVLRSVRSGSERRANSQAQLTFSSSVQPRRGSVRLRNISRRPRLSPWRRWCIWIGRSVSSCFARGTSGDWR